MEGIHRQATLLFVLNSKLYQEIPPPSWKSSETEVVYGTKILTVSFFKVRFLGSFGHLAVLAVGFGASLAGEVSAAIFYRAKASKGS
jgi:hypothetical protein